MCARRMQFSGPTLRPVRKWIIGFAILGACALLLALGISRGLPGWLQDLGWGYTFLFLFGGSVYLFWLSFKQRRIRFGELPLLPQSWVRWILDKPETAKKPHPDR